jgi:ribulose-5-phosphate 4-epimerase/fuculose-1-phosphate aldolase
VSELSTLVELCRRVGSDMLLIQGAGGNVSVKSDDGASIWIKASGVRLRDVCSEAGHVQLDLPRARAALRQGGSEAMRACMIAGAGRPSLETSFHVVLPARVVVHAHAVCLNAFACMRGGRSEAERVLGPELTWVDYAAPGDALGARVAAAVSGRAGCAILLANHGVIVAADSAEQALAELHKLRSLAAGRFGALDPTAWERCEPRREAVAFCERLSEALARCVAPASFYALASPANSCPSTGALVPDDVVFGIHRIQHIGDDLRVLDPLLERQVLWHARHGFLFVARSAATIDTMQEMLLANVLVHRLLLRKGAGEPVTLDDTAAATLLGMEAEQYRQAAVSERRSGVT